MQHSGIQTSVNNRQKLIAQNTKLNKEISMLEKKMSQVITKDIVKVMDEQKKKSQTEGKMQEIVVQESYLKKLKAKLQQLRAMNIGTQTEGIRREQDELKILKKQYEQLTSEKETMTRIHKHKETHLLYNEPLSSYKGEAIDELGKVKKKNAEMQAKLTEIEREIRKYHKYQQMHSALKSQQIIVNNPQYEIKKLDHEKEAWFKKGKIVETKWRPQIEAIDKQYFADKQILDRKSKQIKQLQKELKNWHNRSLASRSESEVILDRERISKVITASPQKKQAKQVPWENLLCKKPKQNSKQKNKKNQTTFSELLKEFKETQKGNQENKKTNELQAIEEAPGQRKWTVKMNESNYATKSEKIELTNKESPYNATLFSEKNNLFSPHKNIRSEELPSSPNKIEPAVKKNAMVNSVAVGTSFYYNEDD